MTSDELKTVLVAVGITQADLGRLIEVTPRAISLWLAGERTIPGSVEAYVMLLRSLPPHLRQVEVARLKERKNPMREGMYGLEYHSKGPKGPDNGIGILVMENGRAYGADPAGAKYDGVYVFNEKTGKADLQLKLTFPPNVSAVFGIVHPYEWSIEVACSMDVSGIAGTTKIPTPFGFNIDVAYKYLRSMPDL